jgi:hypothetical protein
VRLAIAAALVLLLTAPRSARGVPAFRHVVVIVFENRESSSVIGTPQGVLHPSLPN